MEKNNQVIDFIDFLPDIYFIFFCILLKIAIYSRSTGHKISTGKIS